ncbi:MAG: ABC transporter permease [Ruminococcaceae bacterium]|nr:ABC transporter permease [Oscillospiraceae bacterium]
MNGFFRYLRAQTKRAAKAFPAVFVFALITCVCVVAFLSALFSQSESGVEKQVVKVGLCGDLEDTYLDIGLYALENLDASQIYVEFVPLEEDEAKKLLDRGEILGYGLIPEDFVDSVLHGENKQIEYVAGNSPSSLGPQLMNEVVKMVSDFVTETQRCIYAYMDVAKDNGVKRDEYRPKADLLNFSYIQSIIARTDAVEHEITGVGNGLDFKTYYVCAFFLILLMLWGSACASLLIKRDMSLQQLMHSRGRGSFLQILCEFLPFFAIMCINSLLMIYAVVSKSADIQLFPEGVGGAALFFRLIPAILLICAMQFFIYELAHGMISGVLLQMFSIVALSFASGLLLPLYSLPKALQTIAPYLPTGIAFNYVGDVMTESYETNILSVLLCFGVIILLCSLARTYRIRRAQA